MRATSHGAAWSFNQLSEVSPAEFDRRLAELITQSPHNLVSARASRDDVLERHVAEARCIGEQLGRVRGRWMDLGTGGGLPGLVLAHVHPCAQWVLLDASHKKAREAERFAVELGVVCEVKIARAEELAWEGGWREALDGVIARAVAPLRVLVELARGFLGQGGRLVAVKGGEAEGEVEEAEQALRRTRMDVEAVTRLGETRLVTLIARGPAPEGVPRRTGVPQRRPW